MSCCADNCIKLYTIIVFDWCNFRHVDPTVGKGIICCSSPILPKKMVVDAIKGGKVGDEVSGVLQTSINCNTTISVVISSISGTQNKDPDTHSAMIQSVDMGLSPIQVLYG